MQLSLTSLDLISILSTVALGLGCDTHSINQLLCATCFVESDRGSGGPIQTIRQMSTLRSNPRAVAR